MLHYNNVSVQQSCYISTVHLAHALKCFRHSSYTIAVICECNNPPSLQNGVWNPTSGSYNCGSTVTYQCNPGYNLQGLRTITCNQNRQWSGTAPFCQQG